MSQEKPKVYTAEFRGSAVKLANESSQPIAQTARDIGVNENTLPTWISKYSRAVDNTGATRTDDHKRFTLGNKPNRLCSNISECPISISGYIPLMDIGLPLTSSCNKMPLNLVPGKALAHHFCLALTQRTLAGIKIIPNEFDSLDRPYPLTRREIEV